MKHTYAHTCTRERELCPEVRIQIRQVGKLERWLSSWGNVLLL